MKFEIEVVGERPVIVDNSPTAGQLIYIKHLYGQQNVPFLKQQKPETKREADMLIQELERRDDVRQNLEVELIEAREYCAEIDNLRERVEQLEQELADLNTGVIDHNGTENY